MHRGALRHRNIGSAKGDEIVADQQHDSDEDLLSAYRAGDSAALAVLWERHVRPAIVAARSIAPSLDAEDVVSDAYLKIIESIEKGRGPHGAFRPYLYRVVQSVAADKLRSPETHVAELHESHEIPEADPWEDRAFDRNAAAQAFNSLSERWQSVLWYTEVEGLPPREAAQLLGIKPNAVSALASRAREALASAWVEAHVQRELASAECESTLQDLQRYQRGKLTSARSRAVQAHLQTCRSCAAAADEVALLNRKLALILATIFVGGGSATALLGGFTGSTPAAASTGGTIRKHLSSAPARTAVIAGATIVGIAAVVTAALALSASTAPVAATGSGISAAAPGSSSDAADAPLGGGAESDSESDSEDGGSESSDQREHTGADDDRRAFVEILGVEPAPGPGPSEGPDPAGDESGDSRGTGDAFADAASSADGDSSGIGSSSGSETDSGNGADAGAAGDHTAGSAADAGTSSDTDSTASADADTGASSDTGADASSNADADAAASSAASTSGSTDANTSASGDAGSDETADADSDADAGAGSDSSTGGTADSSASTDSDSSASAGSDADIGASSDTGADASSDATADADATASSDADADASGVSDSSAGADADGDSDGGPPIDDADPTLLVGYTCYAENPEQGFVLTGTASTAGVMQARISQPPTLDPVLLVNPDLLSVTFPSGVRVENVFTGTDSDPDQDPWWWSPPLTPLSGWKGLEDLGDAAVSDVIIEMRLFTPDGRHSPWTTVTPDTTC